MRNAGIVKLVIGGTVWLTACSRVQDASSLLVSATASAASRKSGGTLRVALSSGGQTDSLDPTKFLSSGDYCRGFTIYNPLVALDRNMQAMPALAESWESNANADEWVFTLRKGVTFSNGKDFTSADVIGAPSWKVAPPTRCKVTVI